MTDLRVKVSCRFKVYDQKDCRGKVQDKGSKYECLEGCTNNSDLTD